MLQWVWVYKYPSLCSSLRCIPRIRIAGSYVNSMLNFTVSTVAVQFYISIGISLSAPVSPHPNQLLSFSVSPIINILHYYGTFVTINKYRCIITNWSPPVQFRSVAQSCLTLHDPMDHSTPVFSVHHQLPEFTQTHVHWVSDAIQPSFSFHLQSFPASGSFPMSQFFASGGQSIGVWASASAQNIIVFSIVINRMRNINLPLFLSSSQARGSALRQWV